MMIMTTAAIMMTVTASYRNDGDGDVTGNQNNGSNLLHISYRTS